MLLSRLGDYGAGYTWRRGAGGLRGDRMDHHGSPTIAEDRVGVAAECDVGSDNRGVSGAVAADDQREIRNVTRG